MFQPILLRLLEICLYVNPSLQKRFISFYILSCFNKIIKKNGFTKKESLSAIKLLLKGVLENINKEDFKFSDSIQKVASKGGTTEEA